MLHYSPNLLVISSITFIHCSYKERRAYNFGGVRDHQEGLQLRKARSSRYRQVRNKLHSSNVLSHRGLWGALDEQDICSLPLMRSRSRLKAHGILNILWNLSLAQGHGHQEHNPGGGRNTQSVRGDQFPLGIETVQRTKIKLSHNSKNQEMGRVFLWPPISYR